MRLTDYELTEGLTAGAAYLTRNFQECTPREQEALRQKLAAWLSPVLLALPDTATAQEVAQDVYSYEFLKAAQNFELTKLRANPLFEQVAREDLLRRVGAEQVTRSASMLARLVEVCLTAVEELGESARLQHVLGEENSTPLEAVLEEMLLDPLGLDEELSEILTRRLN